MTRDFSGRRVLVTGGASGIGLATAEAFAAARARVAICDRAAGELEAAVARLDELGAEPALGIECDLADGEAIVRCVAEADTALGGIDVLVNNAGIGSARALVDCSDEFIDSILAVNLRAVLLVSREVVRVMQRQGGGNIVNISSLAAKRGSPNSSHYSASKAGVLGLTFALAVELAPAVRVNAICPGVVETAMMMRNIERASERKQISFEEAYAQSQAQVPMGRLQQPTDVAKAVLFLASDDASEITGESLNLTGGMATW